MTAPLQNRLLTDTVPTLAADGRSLDALKIRAQRDPQAAVRQAAQQFEALFMQMVLKSMREATLKSGLFDSPGQDLYTGMLDQQVATQIAGSGTGLADVIARQLTRHMQGAAPAAGPLPPGEAGPGPVAVPAAPARSRSAEPGRPGAAVQAVARYAALAPAEAAGAAGAAPGPRRGAAVDATALATPAVAPAPAAPAATNAQRNFITRHWDSAQQASRATGIPAPFILSQAALESGWGRGEIKDAAGLPSHNLFGIKATGGWQGRTVEVVTTEYDNGVPRRVTEKFRAYSSYSEAFRDWAQLLAGNPRYADVLARSRDAQGFAFGLQRAGYATDPRYGEKLVAVITGVEAALRRG